MITSSLSVFYLKSLALDIIIIVSADLRSDWSEGTVYLMIIRGVGQIRH